MKLGVSYNVFDSEELLEGSILQIRDRVDFISVVVQKTSNFGVPCSENLMDIINDLHVNKKLIDKVNEYKTNFIIGPHGNELYKRNLGLYFSKQAGCTHHMSMDTDEYYLKDQFEYLKKTVEDGDYDSSYCQMKTYYKTWEYQLDPPEDYYVSLIYKIRDHKCFELGKHSPVLVDPTRRIEHGNYKIFTRDEIEMHHGSYIRNNMRVKLENSSASVNFRNDIDKIVESYNNWEYPNQVLLGGLPSKFHNVKKVENLFK